MKGLLLKDFYVTLKSCKMYLIIDAVFIVMSFALNGIFNDSFMFLMLPMLMSGMLTISLLNYDERFKWIKYSGTLPYSPAQIVSAKYLFGLMFQVITTIAVFIALCLWVNFMNGTSFPEAMISLIGMFVFSLIIPSISMPLCYKFGTEKARIIFYVLLVATTMLLVKTADTFAHLINSDFFFVILIAVVVGIYALSWVISVGICKNREITG